MPYSSDVFDDYIKNFLYKWNFLVYFDIGIGAGKYGRIIKSINKTFHVTGVELEIDYIKQFNLNDFYDVLIAKDVVSIVDDDQGLVFDVVIMGDVIEHLLKSDGINLINFLIYRCKKMIIVFPDKYVQYDIDGRKSESHKSIWGSNDFKNFNFIHRKKGYMNLYIIDGFLLDGKSILKPYG